MEWSNRSVRLRHSVESHLAHCDIAEISSVPFVVEDEDREVQFTPEFVPGFFGVPRISSGERIELPLERCERDRFLICIRIFGREQVGPAEGHPRVAVCIAPHDEVCESGLFELEDGGPIREDGVASIGHDELQGGDTRTIRSVMK